MTDRLREHLRDDEINKVIEDVRRHAHWLFRREPPGQTLQPTALVNEAFLRIHPWIQREGVRSAAHLRFLLARSIRRVMVDHVRKRRMLKVTLDQSLPLSNDYAVEVLDLERFLETMAKIDPLAVEIVVARFYGGFTEEEVALQMNRSRSWVQKRWRWVRAQWAKEHERA